jgi:hypothetical protein
MKNLIYFFILLIISLMISCDKYETQVNVKIWPLETGNYWLFLDSSKYLENWEVDTSKWDVNEKIILGNNKYIALTITYSYSKYGNENGLKWLYEYNGNDIISVGAITLSDTLVSKSIMLKNTNIMNDKWPFYQVVYSLDNGLYIKDTIDMSYVTEGELINNKYGLLKYRVYSYNFEANGVIRENDMYFADNIGPIRLITRVNGIISLKRELIEYRIK